MVHYYQVAHYLMVDLQIEKCTYIFFCSLQRAICFLVQYCSSNAACNNKGICGSDGCTCNNAWDYKSDCSGNSSIYWHQSILQSVSIKTVLWRRIFAKNYIELFCFCEELHKRLVNKKNAYIQSKNQYVLDTEGPCLLPNATFGSLEKLH